MKYCNELETISKKIFVARHPVFNISSEIIGYQLQPKTSSSFIDHEYFSELLTDIYPELTSPDFRAVFCSGPCYLPVSAAEYEKILEVFPKNTSIIFEFSDTADDIPTIQKTTSKLHHQGFRTSVALSSVESWEQLKLSNSNLSLNILEFSIDELSKIVKDALAHGNTVIARKVQSIEDFQTCSQLSCTGFQGDYLQLGAVQPSQSLNASQAASLQLCATLQNPDVELEDLTKIIQRDVRLSTQLLKAINSYVFGLLRPVESIRHAVLLLGLQHLKNWASFLALSSDTSQPSCLLKTGLIRAKFCENLAKELDESKQVQDTCFTCGMFSALDILLRQPLDVLLEELPIASDTKNAILEYSGTPGRILKLAKTAEEQQLPDFENTSEYSFTQQEYTYLYLQSVFWAEEAFSEIQQITATTE